MIKDNRPSKKMKTKQIIKFALNHPDLFTQGELEYFSLIKRTRKARKKSKKNQQTSHQ